MVRTKADGGCAASRKVVAARAPRKSLGSSAGCSSSSAASPKGGKNKYAGGNAVCQRPIPDWQKGIGSFLMPSDKDKENAPDSQSSSSSSGGDEIEVLDSGAGASGSCD